MGAIYSAYKSRAEEYYTEEEITYDCYTTFANATSKVGKCPTNCNTGFTGGLKEYSLSSSICSAALNAGVLFKINSVKNFELVDHDDYQYKNMKLQQVQQVKDKI